MSTLIDAEGLPKFVEGGMYYESSFHAQPEITPEQYCRTV